MIALTFQLFAVLAGVIEAVLYARRGAESFTHNEHIEMTLQRLSVALLVLAGALAYRWHGSLVLVSAELLPAALLFPLCHDEAYNFTRLWLTMTDYLGLSDWAAFRTAWEEYEYGYQSPTTTARNDFTGTQRTVLAGVGVTLLICQYVYLLLT